MKGHFFIYKSWVILDEKDTTKITTKSIKLFFEFRERETDKVKVRQGYYGGIHIVCSLVILSWEEDVDDTFGRRRIFLKETALQESACISFNLISAFIFCKFRLLYIIVINKNYSLEFYICQVIFSNILCVLCLCSFCYYCLGNSCV